MDFSDLIDVKEKINTYELIGCDASLGNLFLLKDRYDIKLNKRNGYILREYNYSDSIHGYSFPISFMNSNFVLQDYFLFITENLQRTDIPLCLFTNKQKTDFDEFLEKEYPFYKIDWKTNPADSDYIYLRKNLAELSGQKFQKKRNHILKFYKMFANVSFTFFNKTNFTKKLYNDFMKVAEEWVQEQITKSDFSEIKIYEKEKESVEQAISNISNFDYSGGIVYINGVPGAITLASKISDSVLDIHYEKCLQEYAEFGGYSVINNLFVKNNSSFEYINREEDLGIEGLRKSKLSYKPEFILEKYYGRLIKN